jgi:uncharacterized membrane protein
MARQDITQRAKSREDHEQRQRQRALRRNQIIFAIFSVFLILSMVLSLVTW